MRDFRRRKNKNGDEYGWGIAVYCLPEHLWGYDYVTGNYREDPKTSALRIMERIREVFPEASDHQLAKVLGFKDVLDQPSTKKTLPYPENLISLEGYFNVVYGRLRESREELFWQNRMGISGACT